MNDVATEAQSGKEGRIFRPLIGLLVLLTAISGFAALFHFKVPIENKDAMMFALGAIFQWAAGVVNSEYGATTTGRKVAESAIRKIERADIAASDAPSGTPADPLHAKIDNPPEEPANVTERQP